MIRPRHWRRRLRSRQTVGITSRRSREPFDMTVAGLGGVGWLTQTQAQVLGSDSYVTDKYHWIGETDDVVDVDLGLRGRDGDFEMVYLVTKRTD